MSSWLPASLVAGAVVVLWAVPGVGGQRLAMLRPPTARAVRTPPLLRRRRVVADRRAERSKALDALALLASDLRAGRSPTDAFAVAGSVATGSCGQALAAASSAAALGGDVAGALIVEGSAVPEVLRGLAACWTVCSQAGSGLAAGVERLEEGLRAAEAQRRAVEAELAGPRATAGLLAVLPIAGLGLAAALGADPLHVLLQTPLGVLCLIAGLTLDALGLLWTRRLVARVAPP